jgi:SAM-dependent methyltransferase
MNNLTNKEDWSAFWKLKKNLICEINKNNRIYRPFYKTIHSILNENKDYSVIELGGFPGTYTVLFKKYFNVKMTLIDQFIDQSIISGLLVKNGLNENDISIIEDDLFKHDPKNKYDIVYSFGLVEHFIDTQDIISHHLKFLNPGGTLLIGIPNFRGLNGLIQRLFDKENFKLHNLESMKLKVLLNAADKNGLKDIKVKYQYKFGVWIENIKERSRLLRLLIMTLKLFGEVVKITYPFNSRIFSPYIILTAKKSMT